MVDKQDKTINNPSKWAKEDGPQKDDKRPKKGPFDSVRSDTSNKVHDILKK